MFAGRGYILFVFCLLADVASPLRAAELLNTPVYDPASKSYFEMVNGRNGLVVGYGSHEGPKWSEAYSLAEERVYKGVRGRLAVVKSNATHEFLMRTFQPETNVWIGLRYWCLSEKLQDVTGAYLDKSTFMPWAQNWRPDPFTCELDPYTHRPRADNYMPIAYNGIGSGFRWFGETPSKRFYYFFVEYPTGSP